MWVVNLFIYIYRAELSTPWVASGGWSSGVTRPKTTHPAPDPRVKQWKDILESVVRNKIIIQREDAYHRTTFYLLSSIVGRSRADFGGFWRSGGSVGLVRAGGCRAGVSGRGCPGGWSGAR